MQALTHATGAAHTTRRTLPAPHAPSATRTQRRTHHAPHAPSTTRTTCHTHPARATLPVYQGGRRLNIALLRHVAQLLLSRLPCRKRMLVLPVPARASESGRATGVEQRDGGPRDESVWRHFMSYPTCPIPSQPAPSYSTSPYHGSTHPLTCPTTSYLIPSHLSHLY